MVKPNLANAIQYNIRLLRLDRVQAYNNYYKKAELSQRWPRDAPYKLYGCPENFRESLTTPTATSPEIFNGLRPLNPANGSGERYKLLQQGLGEPQLISNLVHFSLKVWQLVATILMILLRITGSWPVYRKIFLAKKSGGQNTIPT